MDEYCFWICQPCKQAAYQMCQNMPVDSSHSFHGIWFKLIPESQNYCQLDQFRRRQHSSWNLHCLSYSPDLGFPYSELCFLLCICAHSLFTWHLMTIVISSVWSQGSLIPKLCYGSSLQPEGNVLLCCMNTWNNGAPRKSPHFIVCSFHWVGL